MIAELREMGTIRSDRVAEAFRAVPRHLFAPGAPLEHSPYDRIIVTVGAWDIPPVWVEQLADGGRIVVPLRMRGLTRSLALERDGNRLVSRSAMICGFVKMQGAGAYQEHLLLLRSTEIRLRFDDGEPATGQGVGLHQHPGLSAVAQAVDGW